MVTSHYAFAKPAHDGYGHSVSQRSVAQRVFRRFPAKDYICVAVGKTLQAFTFPRSKAADFRHGLRVSLGDVESPLSPVIVRASRSKASRKRLGNFLPLFSARRSIPAQAAELKKYLSGIGSSASALSLQR